MAAPHSTGSWRSFTLMTGVLAVQRVLSGEIASRDFMVRPPEPTPELLVSSPAESVYIGKTDFLRVPFFWNPGKLVNPHLCVVGITGSGKSYFVKTFITRASITLGASALILDWAGEYSDWVRAVGGKVVEFGKDGINLLDTGGATPHSRTRQVMESLEILTDISSFPSQRRLTEEAIEKSYLRKGFSLHKVAARKKPPTLEDVHRILAKKSGRNSDSAEAAHRIKNLLFSSGKSFSESTISLSQLMSGLVCVDLHSLPMESLRSLAGLAILQFVKEKMRASPYEAASKSPRLFVVCDEAWKIASDGRSDVVSIVREGRKYGFSLIVASQNPTDVHRSIFANAGTVLAFRLTLSSERDFLRSSLSYSDFFEVRSHSLTVGSALVHLETAQPVSCPRTFILRKVDGEELLVSVRIKGGGMDLEFEKGELARKMLSFGLTDRQSAALLAEFERKSFSLSAPEFVHLLERFGHSRASAISLLRELGATEKDLLSLFSTLGGAQGGAEALLQLQEPSQAEKMKRNPARKKTAKRKKKVARTKRKTGSKQSAKAKKKAARAKRKTKH